MSRYIDADYILEGIKNDRTLIRDCKLGKEKEHYLSFLERCVEHTPSIDIVRCKECKHWDDHRNDSWWSRDGACLKTSRIGDATYRNADDFCSYGERRE